MQVYEVTSQAIKINGIEKQLEELTLVQRNQNEEMKKINKHIEQLTVFQLNIVQADAATFLSNIDQHLAIGINVDAVTNFILSLGSTLLAITVVGTAKRRNNISTVFGVRKPAVASTLMTAAMTSEEITKALAKIASMTSITSASIVTKRLMNEHSVVSTAFSVMSFLKVLHILGFKDSFLTDRGGRKELKSVNVRFEGTYSLEQYSALNESSNIEYHYLRFNKKNVYILGPNGAGKSTWGNLITQRGDFVTGDSIHTTLIPESIDYELRNKNEIRIWDTPGLFDGCTERFHMERHMDTVIDQQKFYLAVIFVFNGSQQSNEHTLRILDYAIRKFGEKVKKSFIVILNDMDGRAIDKEDSYHTHLLDRGFCVQRDTFYVASSIKHGNQVANSVREKLQTLRAGYVAKHQNFFIGLKNENEGNFTKTLKRVNDESIRQLKEFLNSGSTSIAIDGKEGFFRATCPPKKITLRQYESRFFLRKLGWGNKQPVDTRTILIDKSVHKSNESSINLLNRTFAFEQKRIFLERMIYYSRHTLMTSTADDFEYILFDYDNMQNSSKQETMEMLILESQEYGRQHSESSNSQSLSNA